MAKANEIIRDDVTQVVEELFDKLQVLAGKRFLITGAGGFLCSYLLDLVAALNDKGLNPPCKVIALDNFISGVPSRLEHLKDRSDIEFVLHDVCQRFECEKVDYIIHGASIASPTFYRTYPLETIAVNVEGTKHMLELARKGATSIVYLSSSEVYGDPVAEAIPTKEEYLGNVSCTGPRACYDESKRLAETLCTTYFQLYKVPVKIIRPFNVFGPGQRLDDKRIMPDLISAALSGKPLVLFSNGKATRSFCYISDFIKAMMLVLLSDFNGEVFNVGNDMEEISIGDVAQTVSKAVNPPLPVKFEVSEDKHYLTDNPQRRCPDLTKLRTKTGFKPRVNLETGVKRTIASYGEIQVPVLVEQNSR